MNSDKGSPTHRAKRLASILIGPVRERDDRIPRVRLDLAKHAVGSRRAASKTSASATPADVFADYIRVLAFAVVEDVERGARIR